HTPVLNRLAEESVWFSRAYTTNPSCIPARAAVFTGRYPSQCGVPGYVSCLPKRETTFMKYLQDGGYYTAVIGKQHFWRSEIERGYDYEDIVDEHEPPAVISKELPEGAFGLPANKTVSDRVSSYVEFLADSDFTSGSQLYREINSKGIYEFTGEEKYHVDAYIGDRGRKWLEESCPGDRPWFLTLSFPGPHMPFDGIGLPDEKAYEDTELDLPETGLSDLFEKPPHYLDIARKF
ncbi:sulfatase-like hydrolase/transferase, partial [Hungatella hathewayi]